MKMKRIVSALLAIMAVLFLILVVVRFTGKKEEKTVSEVPAVSVEKPQIRDIELASELIGTIEPASIVHVTPQGSGEVVSLGAATGDMVSAGQMLCVIDTKQVESSRLNMESARVTAGTAASSLQRMQVLFASGDISAQEFESAQNNAKSAQLQYENAKLAYEIQQQNSQVTAPISGRVETFDIKLHDMISPQVQICVISGEGGKSVTFYVTERVAAGLKTGDSLEIEKNGGTYRAVITEASTILDEETGLFKVKAAVEGGEALPTGSSVKLSVISEKAEAVMTVPVDTVYYEKGLPYIYTYEEGAVHKNAVEAGIYDSEYIEIRDGLSMDAQVITTWSSELYEGSSVRLADEAVLGTEPAQTVENAETGGSAAEENKSPAPQETEVSPITEESPAK